MHANRVKAPRIPTHRERGAVQTVIASARSDRSLPFALPCYIVVSLRCASAVAPVASCGQMPIPRGAGLDNQLLTADPNRLQCRSDEHVGDRVDTAMHFP